MFGFGLQTSDHQFSHHSPIHTSHCSLTLRSYISVTDSQHRSQPTEPSTNSKSQTVKLTLKKTQDSASTSSRAEAKCQNQLHPVIYLEPINE